MRQDESVLQRELRQRKPFRSSGQEALLGLLRTADVVRRVVTRVVEPHGVTVQQYNVLRILRGAGGRGLPTLTIRNRMVERMPGITGLLDRLEAKGWVERERCPTDRRQVYCRISEPGLSLLAALDEPMNRVDAEAIGALNERELRTLIALLDRIRESHAEPRQNAVERPSSTHSSQRRNTHGREGSG